MIRVYLDQVFAEHVDLRCLSGLLQDFDKTIERIIEYVRPLVAARSLAIFSGDSSIAAVFKDSIQRYLFIRSYFILIFDIFGAQPQIGPIFGVFLLINWRQVGFGRSWEVWQTLLFVQLAHKVSEPREALMLTVR